VITLKEIILQVLDEDANVAGGLGSVLGAGVVSTENPMSGDRYAPGDARVVKPLGTRVTKRSRIPYSIFAGKVKSKRKKHKKRKKKR
jgi:hypothetical protein